MESQFMLALIMAIMAFVLTLVFGHRKRKEKVGSIELINLSRSYLRQSLLKTLESSHRFDPSKLEAHLLEKE